jgi:RNA polymerase sigma factor (sigma-70 family)
MEAATARLRHAPPARLSGALNRLASDRKLVERYASGDDGAFRIIYERHRPRVFAICLGVLGDLQDAEDATQEAFASAASGIRRSAPDDLRAWLGRVSRNAAIDAARSRKPRAADVEAEDQPDAREPASEAVARAELADLLAGLRLLAERQRMALVLRELGGYSYAEIAATIETDEAAVRGLIARARVALRAHAEASAMTCSVVRERLAAELDGRRRPAEVRRHLRSCQGCRSFRSQARGDARALRGIAPDPVGGALLFAGVLAVIRPRATLIGGGGLLAKTSMGAKAVTVGAACVVSLCGVEGARELGANLVLPVPLPSAIAGSHHHAKASTAASARRSPASVSSAGASFRSASVASDRPLTSMPEQLASARRATAVARGRRVSTAAATHRDRGAGVDHFFPSGAGDRGYARDHSATAGAGRPRRSGDANTTGTSAGWGDPSRARDQDAAPPPAAADMQRQTSSTAQQGGWGGQGAGGEREAAPAAAGAPAETAGADRPAGSASEPRSQGPAREGALGAGLGAAQHAATSVAAGAAGPRPAG